MKFYIIKSHYKRNDRKVLKKCHKPDSANIQLHPFVDEARPGKILQILDFLFETDLAITKGSGGGGSILGRPGQAINSFFGDIGDCQTRTSIFHLLR